MNPQDPLANLHPLREPALIGWWPPAPGWWILLALVLLAIAVLGFFAYRHYRANAYRRQACVQLQLLHNKWLSDQDNQDYCVATNALLKSVALRAFPRQDVASRSGENWLNFLNDALASGNASSIPFDQSFADAAYRQDASGISPQEIHRSSMAWVKQHKVAP